MLWRSATEQVGLPRDGAVSAAELLNLHLERVAAINPALNAVVGHKRSR
jgi:Asp-tRNA(Asn)/Glu-tRNA(Gln) amidotransferase A subunit family amidase